MDTQKSVEGCVHGAPLALVLEVVEGLGDGEKVAVGGVTELAGVRGIPFH